jgi:hypothetical protein
LDLIRKNLNFKWSWKIQPDQIGYDLIKIFTGFCTISISQIYKIKTKLMGLWRKSTNCYIPLIISKLSMTFSNRAVNFHFPLRKFVEKTKINNFVSNLIQKKTLTIRKVGVGTKFNRIRVNWRPFSSIPFCCKLDLILTFFNLIRELVFVKIFNKNPFLNSF